MFRIFVISDTHGMIQHCTNYLAEHGDNIDFIIHAGDYIGDAREISDMFPSIPMYSVKGNNDVFCTGMDYLTISLTNARIYVTHGHQYRVKYESNAKTLAKKATQMGADICIFGHTHIPYTGYTDGVTMLNPGSAGFFGEYAILEIDGKKVRTKLCKFSETV